MKKQTLNRRVRIAGALLLAALLLSAVVAPLALLASPSTGISGEGALSFASAEEPDVTPVPDHDQASLEEQSKILAGENRNDRGWLRRENHRRRTFRFGCIPRRRKR